MRRRGDAGEPIVVDLLFAVTPFEIEALGRRQPLRIPKTEARYNQKWDAAEATRGCATTSDKVRIEAKVDGFVSDAFAELPATTTTTTTTTTLPQRNCPEGFDCIDFGSASSAFVGCGCLVRIKF